MTVDPHESADSAIRQVQAIAKSERRSGVIWFVVAVITLFLTGGLLYAVNEVRENQADVDALAAALGSQRDQFVDCVDVPSTSTDPQCEEPVAPEPEDIADVAVVPGPRGGEGPRGPQGLPGQTGADGAVGPASIIPGPPGPSGSAGADGANGLDGGPGASGLDGGPGADGADGQPGLDGAPGADGATGPAGADGAPGRGILSIICDSLTPLTLTVTYTDGTETLTCGGAAP